MVPDPSDRQDAGDADRAPADHHDDGRHDRLVDPPQDCGGDVGESQGEVEQAADVRPPDTEGDHLGIAAEGAHQLICQKEHHNADGLDHQDHACD